MGLSSFSGRRVRLEDGGRAISGMIYTVAALIFLLCVWNQFCKHFAPQKKKVRIDSPVYGDYTENENVPEFLAGLPAKSNPRVLVLGSSQVRGMKDKTIPPQPSIPVVLHKELNKHHSWDVVCLDAGGQIIVESVCLLLDATPVVRPDIVIMCVGLFSMQGVMPRPRLIETLDMEKILNLMRSNIPADIIPGIFEELTSFRNKIIEPKQEGGESLQQICDRLLMEFLGHYMPMVQNRQVMFDTLIDTPVRRDMVTYFKRNIGGIKVSRTYDIGAAYEPSLAAIAVAANYCRKLNIPLILVVMPFESTRSPVVYLPETQARIVRDLRTMSEKLGCYLVDLGYFLPVNFFGTYEDGSPDNLHYMAAGHELAGKSIADFIVSQKNIFDHKFFEP